MDYYNVSLHDLFFMNFFLLFFFQNGLCQFYFVVFFLKILWIVTMFPHMVFVLLQCFSTCFFLNYLCRFFFNIELVENYNCRFSHMFFFSLFFPKFSFFFIFFVFFFRIIFVDFIFFNMELVDNLAL